MFEVNGMRINVDGMTLLNDLQTSLQQNGISLLHTIKPGATNIMISCPSHNGGQERKPSCGMSITDVYRNGKLIPAGTVHCFACGYTATLDEFISFCFGKKDGGLLGNKWLKSNYVTELLQKRRDYKLNWLNTSKNEELPTIPYEALDRFRYYHDYMFERGLTEYIIEWFDVGYDRDTKEIVFPISNLKGEVKWLLRRSIKHKFYKIPEQLEKTNYLYGAYECIKESPKEVYIVESVFNALTLWTLGKCAIALLGTGGGNQYKLLNQLPFRHYILALDNDEAGREGQRKLIDALRQRHLLSELIYDENPHPKAKDINDLREQVLGFKINPINF